MTELMNYGENQLIECLFRNSSLSRPSTWYVALSTTAPNEDGTNVSEPSDANYARQGLDTGASSEWSDPSGGGSTDNTGELAWPAADTGFGTIGWIVLYDAVSGGNPWFWTALQSSVTVGAGEVFRFPAGDLDVAFD